MKPTPRIGGHGHHAGEGNQLCQVPAAASQGMRRSVINTTTLSSFDPIHLIINYNLMSM